MVSISHPLNLSSHCEHGVLINLKMTNLQDLCCYLFITIYTSIGKLFFIQPISFLFKK